MEGRIISETLLFMVMFTLLMRFLQHYWNKQNTKAITGISDVPFISDASALIKYCVDTVSFVINLFRPNPDWYGPPIGIFIKDPKDIEIVLSSQKALAKEMVFYKVLLPFVGHGLATSDVTTWKKDRKLMSPSFSQKNVVSYYDIFVNNANLVVERMKKEIGKDLFDVHNYLCEINLKTICETSLGVDQNNENLENFPKLVKGFDYATTLATQRLLKIWNFIDFTYNWLPLKKKTDKAAAYIYDTMNSIIEASKSKYSAVNMRQNSEEVSEKTRKKSLYLLQNLMDQHHSFTDEQIRDQINTVIFAGYETSASTVAFALMILGIYPKIQEKVYQEILEVVGPNKQIEYDDLKNLHYMERVLKETLRLFPIAPFVARVAEEDIKLSNRIARAGSSLIVPILYLQKDPAVWPNPNKFDEDRFLPEEIAKRHPYSWIPFSAGPRNCIGIRYGWITMKVIMTTILQEYRITSCYNELEDVPMIDCVISKPTNGHIIQIHKRNASD